MVQGFAFGRGRATTMVELLSALAGAGHTVEVAVTAVLSERVVGGVRVSRFGDVDPKAWYDVIVYNSGLPSSVLHAVRRMRGRKLMCQHSYQTDDPGLRFADRVWFPSHSALSAHRRQGVSVSAGKFFVVPPPIDPERYRTVPGRKIGLCLSSPWKGGVLVSRMASLMPEQQFLVVKDGRGNGVGLFRGLRNVELVGFMDPRKFYSRIRVQLFPSRSETYGRVGVEGAVSGIPLVASMCPGVREAMQGHAIRIDRANTALWVSTVTRLMTDEDAWESASREIKKRADNIDYTQNREEFVYQVGSMVTDMK